VKRVVLGHAAEIERGAVRRRRPSGAAAAASRARREGEARPTPDDSTARGAAHNDARVCVGERKRWVREERGGALRSII
jgi:hypothetical protein